MRQTIVSVILPISSNGSAAVEARIAELQHGSLSGTTLSARLTALPALHFLSMMVFGSDAGVLTGQPSVTPLFVLEANFDGASGPFWASLENSVGEPLREILRVCAPPRSDLTGLFGAVTAPLSREPLAPLLQACSVFPAAFHRGNRGLSRSRILRHAELFDEVQKALAAMGPRPALAPEILHDQLRAVLAAQPQFGWLNEPWPARLTCAEYACDVTRAALFVALFILAAAAPWFAAGLGLANHFPAVLSVASLVPAAIRVAQAALLVSAVTLFALKDIGDLPRALELKPRPNLWWQLAAGSAGAALGLAVLPAHLSLAALLLLLSGAYASTLLLLAALRWHERRIETLVANPDPDRVRALQAWEDRQPDGADHMGSIVVLKRGWFWAVMARLGFQLVNRFVQITGRRGYLGSVASNRIMRTIHFAHWAFVDRGRRLIFLSNFDGSWESYLDDFIEKEHVGLTLAWGCGLGFPPSRYLSLDGASQGRAFKAWARLSMAPTRIHFAAYPNLTVNLIVRQARLAKGLARRRLDPAAAATWAEDL